jgi:hypothetical protein
VNFPGTAERRPLGKGGAPDKQTITTHQYSMPLPLTAAVLTDAWVTEVLLTVRLRRALRRLMAALDVAEGGAL